MTDRLPAHVAGLRDGRAGRMSAQWELLFWFDKLSDQERSEYWEAWHCGLKERADMPPDGEQVLQQIRKDRRTDNANLESQSGKASVAGDRARDRGRH